MEGQRCQELELEEVSDMGAEYRSSATLSTAEPFVLSHIYQVLTNGLELI